MKRMKNESHIEGYVYEHKLEMKESGPNSKNPGTEFISGTLSVTTDDEMLNVVQVHFTYVTAVTAKGKPNNTFNVLQSIIDGKIGSVMEHGKEPAGKGRSDSAIGRNEWYDKDGKLVSVRRNEGGFVHQVQELCEPKARATFNTDMVITNVRRVEADEEKETPEKAIIKGCVFDFRNALLPVEFSVYAPYAPAKALDYFENLGASANTPVFTRVQGIQVSKTVVRKIEEENAFGEAIVKESRSSQRDMVINWAQPETYEWDSEDTLLASEFSEMIAAREVYLADVKKRQDEYQASRGNAAAGGATKATAPAKGEYNF
mgnify:FL=1